MVLPLPAKAPVILLAEIVQLKVVPVTPLGFVNAMLVVDPPQSVCVDGVANTFGIAFTVTVATTGIPVHPEATGVMVYVAVPPALLLAVNVCTIGPLTGVDTVPPLLAPVALLCVTVQKYCVPDTEFGLPKAMLVAVPLQIT